jgi:hypothetical protein
MRNADLTEDQKRDGILRAAEAGDICTECFCWIPPDAPVAIVHEWMATGEIWRLTGHPVRKRLNVPICRDCAQRNHRTGYDVIAESRRCETCGREMRYWDLYYFPRTCCRACGYAAALARSKLRRRVTHEPMICIECGRTFIPKRADALTCSNKCRQARHRGHNCALCSKEAKYVLEPSETDERVFLCENCAKPLMASPMRHRAGCPNAAASDTSNNVTDAVTKSSVR